MSGTHQGGTTRPDGVPNGGGDAEASTRSGRRRLLALLVVIISTKVVVLAAGVLWARHGALSIRDYERNFHHHRLIARYTDPTDIRFFELWGGSDAQWYLAIAEDGYPTRSEIERATESSRPKLIAKTDVRLKYAFFPMWPLVIRVAGLFVPDLNAAAFLAANVLSLAALLLLYRVLAARSGRGAAFWTITLMACWPYGMFLHVPFTESLFLFLCAATFAACEKRRWHVAGVCIGLAMVTRPNGLALVAVPLVQHAAWLWGRRPRAWKQSAGLLWLLLGVIPVGAFLIHNTLKTGDPFYFTRVSDWWGYQPASVWSNLWHNTLGAALQFPRLPTHGFHRSQIDVLVLAVWACVLVVGLRVVPGHYSAYGMLVVLIPLMTKGDLMSFSRYALMAWPVFHIPVVLMKESHRAWAVVVISLGFLLFQARNMGEFVNWHWVG